MGTAAQPILTDAPERSAATTASSTRNTRRASVAPTEGSRRLLMALANSSSSGTSIVEMWSSRSRAGHHRLGKGGVHRARYLDLELRPARPAQDNAPSPAVDVNGEEERRCRLGDQALGHRSAGEIDLESRGFVDV